jgi:hypothetical protein
VITFTLLSNALDPVSLVFLVHSALKLCVFHQVSSAALVTILEETIFVIEIYVIN